MLQEIVNKSIELGAIQKPTELYYLLQLLTTKELNVVVEIGTAKGGTFYALCQMADKNASIISLDMPGGDFGGAYAEDVSVLSTYGRNGQHLSFIRMNSHSEAAKKKLVKALEGQQIDFLMIDGDHTYEGCKQDWEMYSPLVRPGGIIAFHDICYHPHMQSCQVNKVWEEIEYLYESSKIIDYSDSTWGGIGLVIYGEKKTLDNSGLLLDIGKGEVARGFTRGTFDLEKFPWPVLDDSVHILIGSHVIEHIKPWLIMQFFDELWRVIKPSGQVALSTPYAGSAAWWSDPTHCTGFNERSFTYLDPEQEAYNTHKPKPWRIEKGNPIWQVNGNLEVLLMPRK